MSAIALPMGDAKMPTKCIATTDQSYNQPMPTDREDWNSANFFANSQLFSPDGTTIVAMNQRKSLSTFLLPADLLDESQQPRDLRPCPSSYHSSTSLRSHAFLPHYDLANPQTHYVLCAEADLPMSMRCVSNFDWSPVKYRWVNPHNEQHNFVNSLAFIESGYRFVAGSNNRIAIFDVSRAGSGPFAEHTLKARHHTTNIGSNQMCYPSMVSTLGTSNDRILAVGTYTREVALFESEGQGGCISAFSVAEPLEQPREGSGVTHLRWSPCNKYLFIVERESDTILVYDVRNTQQRVCTLIGRNALTRQRLGVDVRTTAFGYEVWAGSTDGHVRVWNNPGSHQGPCVPDGDIALHTSPVSSLSWYPKDIPLLATGSGQRFHPLEHKSWDSSDDSDNSSDTSSDVSTSGASETSDSQLPFDNSLKLWVPVS